MYKNLSFDLHEEFANQHYENPKLFVKIPDRHSHFVATSIVLHEYLTETAARTSNTDFLKCHIKQIHEWLDGPTPEDAEMESLVILAELSKRWQGNLY